jgi:hypothetical protein
MDIEQIIIDIKKRVELFSAEVFADDMLKQTRQDWIDEYLKDTHYDIVTTITDRSANEQKIHVFEDGIIRELDHMEMREEITEEELDFIREECDLN